MKIKLVLNKNYGGFCLSNEIAEWLSKKGWSILHSQDYDNKKEHSLETIVSDGRDYFYAPHMHKIEFRSHPDLIECIETLQAQHKNDSFSDRYYSQLFSLKVVEININIDIEQYNDGYERVNISSYESNN